MWCLVSVLLLVGVGCGDMVVVFLFNMFVMVEVYFGVLMVGGVFNVLNICLDVVNFVFMLCYGEVCVLLVDIEFVDVVC